MVRRFIQAEETVNVVRCTAVATVGGNAGGLPLHGICTFV